MPVAPIVIAATLRRNPDGTLRTTNPFGDFNPAPATLSVDQPAFAAALGSLLGFLTGAGTFSLNLRGAWLTGSEAATCTFGVRTIAGDAVASHNWTVSGSTFSQTRVSGSIGSGTLELFAVDSGGFELSFGQYTWSVAAPAGGADILPPTIPTGLAVTTGAGVLNVSFDASSDRYDGSIAPSGMDHYRVFLDGVFNKNVAAANNPAQQFVTTSIGASAPAATATETNGIVTLTAAGIGIHNNAAEECVFRGIALAGDGTLTAKLDAFTSAGTFSTSGLMIRETLTQGAIFGAVYVQPSAGALGLQVKRRLATGGNGTNANSVSAITSSYVRLTRTGATVIASYSTDGNTWTDIASMTLPMAATVYWGTFLSSQNAGVACTSTIREVNLNQIPRVSTSVTTTGTHAVTVSAVDVAVRESLKCAAVTATASGGGAINVPTKLTGGVWWTLDQNTALDTQFAQIAAIKAASPLSTGIEVFWQLANFENPNVPGDYSGNWAAAGQAGYQLVDRFLNECGRVGFKCAIHIYTYGGGGTAGAQTTFRSNVLPTYMSGSAYGPNSPTTTGRIGGLWVNGNVSFGVQTSVKSFVVFWEAPVMARFNEWGRNMALRYDDDPRLEMMSFQDETAVPNITGWSVGALKACLMGPTGMFAVQRGYWKKTRLRLWDNYVGNDDDMDLLQREAVKYNWTCGGPDTAADPDDPSHVNPNNGFSSSRTQSGDYAWMQRTSGTANRNVVNVNYQNKLSIGNRVAQIEGEDITANTPAGQRSIGDGYLPHIIAHANKLQCSDVFIFWNTFVGPNYNRVNTAHPNLVDFVNSMLLGGAVAVNGVTAGVSLQYSGVRPSGW